METTKEYTIRILADVEKYTKESLTGSLWCPEKTRDANPWLLGVKNGVLDLKKGIFRPGRPEDMIRTPAPVKWEGFEAECPHWEKFVVESVSSEVLGENDEELVLEGTWED